MLPGLSVGPSGVISRSHSNINQGHEAPILMASRSSHALDSRDVHLPAFPAGGTVTGTGSAANLNASPRTPRSAHRLRTSTRDIGDIKVSKAPSFYLDSDSPISGDLPRWKKTTHPPALDELVKDGVKEILRDVEGSLRNPTADREGRLPKRAAGMGKKSVEDELQRLELDKSTGFSRPASRTGSLIGGAGGGKSLLDDLRADLNRGISGSGRQRSATEDLNQLPSTVVARTASAASTPKSRPRSKTEPIDRAVLKAQVLKAQQRIQEGSRDTILATDTSATGSLISLTPTPPPTDRSTSDVRRNEYRPSAMPAWIDRASSMKSLSSSSPLSSSITNLEPLVRPKTQISGHATASEYFSPLRGPSKLPPVSREEQRQWDRKGKAGGGGAMEFIKPKANRGVLDMKDFDANTGRPLRPVDLDSLTTTVSYSPTTANGGCTVIDYPEMRHRKPLDGVALQRSSFEVLDCIGRGSCSRVVLATLGNNAEGANGGGGGGGGSRKPYAMKIMKKSDLVRIPDGAISALNERDLLRGCRHRFIVEYFGCCQDVDALYLVMAFVPFTLRSILRKEERLTESAARFYAAEVGVTIDWLHCRGILYRDVKVDNVLIDSDGHIKLCDFGSADRKADTGSDRFVGTGVYMAPEVVLSAHYGKAVDWWGVGSFIYELIAGQAPFARSPGAGTSLGARADPEVFLDILDSPLHLPRHVFSDPAIDLIVKLMSRQPDKRLGARGGVKELRCHPWFKDIASWSSVEDGGLIPPFYPGEIKGLNARAPVVKRSEVAEMTSGDFLRGDMGWEIGNGKFRMEGHVGALQGLQDAEKVDWDLKMEYQIRKGMEGCKGDDDVFEKW
ncbi:RAC-gamma serine/threonine-protein kinase [Irineochytrium annulatum]|nr:RAC-gamma serine/threonine-protein kinase [Irineochytrium annulatum]